MLQYYQFFGFVETRIVPDRSVDIQSRWQKLRYNSFDNPAVPTFARGSHGGEAFIAHAALPCVKVDPILIKQLLLIIDCPQAFSACEYRTKGMTILFIVSYLWSGGEGLSSRNWLILQQLICLIKVYGIPFHWWSDFNNSPLAIADSGILSLAKGVITVPDGCESTAKWSGIIDFAIHSVCLQPAIGP